MQLVEGQSGFTRVNLYEQIADYIEKRILAGEDPQWAAGAKLPPEQELADYFGVSRNVVREAIKVLKERGLCEPRNGVGVYITRPDDQKIAGMLYRFVLMGDLSVDDIYEARSLIECHTAEMAALRCSDDQLAAMRSLLNRMEEESLDINTRREYDFAFHAEIAKAAKNPVIEMMLTSLHDVFLAMIEKGIMNLGGIEDASQRHERIFRALTLHDPVKAREAMKDHLDYSLYQVKRYETEQKEHTGESSSSHHFI